MQVSFSGFCLNEIMEITHAFSVGRSTSKTSVGIITFDTVLIDTFDLWDEIDNACVVETSGMQLFAKQS